MYRIANGQLKEVAVEELKEYACKPVNAVARLPYVCEYGLDKLNQHFVTYHLNVPKTYAAILRNPFHSKLPYPFRPACALRPIACRKSAGNSLRREGASLK